jgi:hypothetical protein
MDNKEIYERLQDGRGIEWGGAWFNPDNMHRRLLERLITLEAIRAKELEAVSGSLGAMLGITIGDRDGTGWLYAETPIGVVGNYVTMVSLLSAIIFEYQKQLRIAQGKPAFPIE